MGFSVETFRLYQRERRALLNAHGLCVDCKATTQNGFRRCNRCLAKAARRTSRWRTERA